MHHAVSGLLCLAELRQNSKIISCVPKSNMILTEFLEKVFGVPISLQINYSQGVILVVFSIGGYEVSK